MSFPPGRTEARTADPPSTGRGSVAPIGPAASSAPQANGHTAALHATLEVGGSQAIPVRDILQFEGFLADLSATFVSVSADQVDSRIVSALRQIVEFLGIDRSGFGELMGDQMVITHSYELPGVPPAPRIILEAHFPVYAAMVRAGEPFRLPDDLPQDAVVERGYCTRSGLQSQLTIPLKVTGAVVGGIGFASLRERLEWPEELVRRLRLVGDIFTNALARKRADEALRALAARLLTAQEEERRRVAREMHDDWTQRLAVMGLDLARLERHIGDPGAALPFLHTMRGQLVALSEDVHALSRQLHPSILDDLGLAEALRSECAAVTRREGIAITYRADGVPRTVPPDVALCVYRVAQESLRNLAKHAAVGEAWVTVVATEQELVLQVRDQGVGFDPSAVRTKPGLGLASMQERARLVRAELSLTSAPGQGTTVELRAPLREGHA